MESPVNSGLELNELRLFASAFCVYFAYSTWRNMPELLRWYASHRGLFPGRKILGIWKPFTPSRAVLAALLTILAFTLLANAVWPSRWNIVLAIALYFLIFPGLTDFHLVGHAKSTLTPLVLFLLLLSDDAFARPLTQQAADVGSVGGGWNPGSWNLAGWDLGGWGLVSIRLLIAIVYFGLGVEKIRESGWGWARGGALRWYLIEHYAWGRFSPARHLINRPAALRVLSTVTLGMQILAPLIVLGGWFPAAHGFVAIGFHLSTQLFMGIHFLPFFGPIVVSSALTHPVSVLVESSLAAGWVPAASLVSAGPSPEPAGWQVTLMLLIVLAQVWSQVTGRCRFPFLSYQLFSGDFSAFRRPGILLLEIGGRDGTYRPWRPRHSYDVRDVSHLGYDLTQLRTRLSSKLESTFRLRYWPVIRRERMDDGVGIRSVRLVWRFPAWKGDKVVRYDDFAIGDIPITDGKAGSVELLEPTALRSRPLWGDSAVESELSRRAVRPEGPDPSLQRA